MPNPLSRYWQWWILENYLNAPRFLRDDLPPSASGLSRFGQELGRRACRKVARQPGIAAGQQLFWSGLCDPYLESIEEGPTEPGEITNPPFTGGQCPGVAYLAQVEGDTGFSDGWSGVFTGPISQIYWDFDSQVGNRIYIRPYCVDASGQIQAIPKQGPVSIPVRV